MPAMAFCASLRTSVATCIGWTNSVTRKKKPISRPEGELVVGGEHDTDAR